jgi:hypothetical protein
MSAASRAGARPSRRVRTKAYSGHGGDKSAERPPRGALIWARHEVFGHQAGRGRELLYYDERDDANRSATDARKLPPPAPASEIRYDPVLDEWVAVAAHRQERTFLLPANECTGRLDAHFSVRSVFGRPIGFASRAAGERFLATHYQRFSG